MCSERWPLAAVYLADFGDSLTLFPWLVGLDPVPESVRCMCQMDFSNLPRVDTFPPID